MRPSAVARALEEPWLVVTGGAHRHGGQDRANLELIRYLSREATGEIHVVAHEVNAEVAGLPRVRLTAVNRPLGSIALGERLLELASRRIHARLGASAVVVANGGNYPAAILNWVHSVHAVWPVRDDGAPLSRRAFNRVKKWDAVRRERRALRVARLLVANSERTKSDLIAAVGIASERIRVIRFGADGTPGQRTMQTGELRLAFIGALGWDRNKGLDVALKALRLLETKHGIRATLTVAGAGSVSPWVRMARELDVLQHVRFVGMVEDIPALLRDADLMVAPARYEAYGLAIQEALVAGVPALTSASAGIAPLVARELPQLVVPENAGPEAWATAIRDASRSLETLSGRTARLGSVLAQRSWEAMAAEIVREVEGLETTRP